MIGKDEIAEAARYADARAQELGLPGWCEQYGIEMDGLAYVAEQRAIRAGMTLEGKDPAKLPQDRATAVRLSPAVNELIPFLAAVVMDGIAIGYTMRERQQQPPYDARQLRIDGLRRGAADLQGTPEGDKIARMLAEAEAERDADQEGEQA